MINNITLKTFIVVLLINFSLNAQTQADETQATSTEDLAKQLPNPLASLISIPFQNNFDFNVGQIMKQF